MLPGYLVNANGMKRVLFILSGIVLYFFSGNAQPLKPVTGETYAIVAGISNYHYIKPLNYADSDADLFAEFLISGAGGSVKPENLFLLKNDSANAGNFWSALYRISNKNLRKGDRVYIYFAGHGDAIRGINEYYLLLSDCQPANDGNNYMLSFGAIDMYHLKNRIGLITRKGVEVVLVLDACRTNELAGGYASQVFSTSIIQSKVGEIAMLATGPGQVSIEDASFGRGHGLFTYNLVDALSGRADREEGGNNDRVISLSEVQKWVGKQVPLMSGKFKVSQIPVFCCEENNSAPIGFVDSSFMNAWNQFKSLNDNNSNRLPSVKTQRGGRLDADTGATALFNQFNAARRENRLWGERSADQYYEQLQSRFPGDAVTEDARYMLASDFINFAQQKINLYLEGKDQLSLESMREKNDSANAPGFLSETYERLRKAAAEKWTIAGRMVRKAGMLLSTQKDSSLLLELKPKINFLLARGFVNQEKESDLNDARALQYALDAYRSDSTAAYTAECLGLVYAFRNSYNRLMGAGIDAEFEFGSKFRKSDTAIYFFRKAIRLAPNWVSPYRSLGLKIFGLFRFDSAAYYMQHALALAPADATTCIMLGDLYYGRYRDSAFYYYRRALSFATRSSLSVIYRRIARLFLNVSQSDDPAAFKTDSVLYYSRLAVSVEPDDPENPDRKKEMYRDVYMNIGQVFMRMQQPDSAVSYYLKVIELMPDYEWAYRGIAGYYTGRKKPDSVLYFCHLLLGFSPQNGFAMSRIAQYYDDKKGFSDSAIWYYRKALDYKADQDLVRERLAYLLMAQDRNNTEPLNLFMLSLNEFPSGWRYWLNVACYYANNGNTEKSLEYLEKALQLGLKPRSVIDRNSWLTPVRDTEAFKNMLSKYFPG